MRPLKKTTIVIWSEVDNPMASDDGDLADLASDAIDGDSYCSKQLTELVQDPTTDPDWDNTGFFDTPEDEDDATTDTEDSP